MVSNKAKIFVFPQNQTRSGRSDRITTFRDLKRTLASSFSGSSQPRIIKGLSSNSQEGFSVGRSSFYEAEAAYEEAQSRPVSAMANSTYTEHIYEEIPEHMHSRNHNGECGESGSSSSERPLPPIPERSDNKVADEEEDKSSDDPSKQPRRRGGSFFEGASKYEILLYLRDAKDRIGYTDFEIELENEEDQEAFIGRRNAGHRVR